MLEDSGADDLEWVEQAHRSGIVARLHFDTAKGRALRNSPSLAFGGVDLRTAWLGCLPDDRLRSFRAPLAGYPPPDWTIDLGALGGFSLSCTEHPAARQCRGDENMFDDILSVAMMLGWLGDRHANAGAARAGLPIPTAVDAAFVSGNLLPFELGGGAGTKRITEAVFAALQAS